MSGPDSAFGRAAVPSGASTGEREALELRDGDSRALSRKGRAQGRRAHQRRDRGGACAARRSISARSTRRSSRSTARPPRAASAPTRCSASRWPPRAPAPPPRQQPLYAAPRAAQRTRAADGAYLLPVPMMNILNGGAHADSSVDLQEFMVMPARRCRPSPRRCAPAPRSFTRCAAILKKAGHSTGVGDEGGFAPNLKSNREALDLVARGDRQGRARAPGTTSSSRSTSPRASSGTTARTSSRSRASRRARRTRWSRCTPTGCGEYPIVSIEDGVAEGDWDGWKALTRALGDRVQLVGDDVFVTNPEILRRGSPKASATRCWSS